MAIQTYTLILKSAKMVTPQVRHLVFGREDGKPANFTPGQFITILFEYEGKKLRRSYSIATIPNQSNDYEIAVGEVKDGPGTTFLFGLQSGDRVTALGPVGKLVLPNTIEATRLILIATGTGVTPYRSMLPELARRFKTSPLKTILLLGVQNRQHFLYSEDFLSFANQYPEFQFIVSYSREQPATLLPYERTGYVQSHLNELELNPKTDLIYLCGNPGMIDETYPRLLSLGFDSQQIKREKYISS